MFGSGQSVIGSVDCLDDITGNLHFSLCVFHQAGQKKQPAIKMSASGRSSPMDDESDTEVLKEKSTPLLNFLYTVCGVLKQDP